MRWLFLVALATGCSKGEGGRCRVEMPAQLAGTTVPARPELRSLLAGVARRLEGSRAAPLAVRLRYLEASFDSSPEAGCRALRDARSALAEAKAVDPTERNAVALVLDLVAAGMSDR
jgi:hypothetical protein